MKLVKPTIAFLQTKQIYASILYDHQKKKFDNIEMRKIFPEMFSKQLEPRRDAMQRMVASALH